MRDAGACVQLDALLSREDGECAPTPALPRYAGEGAQHHLRQPLDLRILR